MALPLVKVEIGAGGRVQPGWLSVDLNPRRADVVADAMHLPFADGSIDAMRAVDVLEHVSYRLTDRVLAEWARVCCRGADLYVRVPDADAIMRRYVATVGRGGNVNLAIPADQGLPQTALAGAAWRILGGHDDGERVDTAAGDDWRWNAHYSMWSFASLTSALDKAGFDVIRCPTNPFPNLCCEAIRR